MECGTTSWIIDGFLSTHPVLLDCNIRFWTHQFSCTHRRVDKFAPPPSLELSLSDWDQGWVPGMQNGTDARCRYRSAPTVSTWRVSCCRRRAPCCTARSLARSLGSPCPRGSEGAGCHSGGCACGTLPRSGRNTRSTHSSHPTHRLALAPQLLQQTACYVLLQWKVEYGLTFNNNILTSYKN